MKPATLLCWLKIKNKYYCYHSHQNNYNHLHAELSEAKLALNFLFSYLSLLDVGIPGMCNPTSTFIGFVFEDEKIKT